jgi:hypothetical protein
VQRDNARVWQAIWFGVAVMLAGCLVITIAGGAQ